MANDYQLIVEVSEILSRLDKAPASFFTVGDIILIYKVHERIITHPIPIDALREDLEWLKNVESKYNEDLAFM